MTNLGLGVDLSQICAINFWPEWKQGCEGWKCGAFSGFYCSWTTYWLFKWQVDKRHKIITVLARRNCGFEHLYSACHCKDCRSIPHSLRIGSWLESFSFSKKICFHTKLPFHKVIITFSHDIRLLLTVAFFKTGFPEVPSTCFDTLH